MKTPAQQLATAIALAAAGHEDQLDKGGKPYILHPIKVMHYLRTEDYELMAIAVLHDYIEDCAKKGATYEQLREHGLSDRVVRGVRCLTKVPGETEEEYQAKVASNYDSVLAKLADVRHNSDIRRLKGVTEKDIRRMEKYQKFKVFLDKVRMEYETGVRT
jgi:(p)ppGpp synthase/HD superfamily hydrolase